MPTPATDLTCPNCDAVIELSEVMRAQVTASLRAELDAEAAATRKKLADRTAQLDARQQELKKQAESVAERVEAELAAEREKLAAHAKRRAEAQVKLDLDAGREERDELTKRLAASNDAVLQARRRERELAEREAGLKTAEQEMAARLRTQMRVEFEKKTDEAAKAAGAQARAELAEQMKQRDAEADGLRAKVKAANEKEVGLLKTKRELEEKQERLELEVQRKLDAERKAIRDQTLRQAAEENDLKAKEKEQQIEAMRKTIDELKRKAEQGSQQLQGEVQELALEDLLCDLFPADRVEDVPKGIRGADVLQHVVGPAGQDCGSILWESKRTRAWSKAWPAKLRDDQRTAKAHVALIVTAAMPEGVSGFGKVGEVWVCSWAMVRGAAAALRESLIGAARQERALEGRQTKTELVYSYLGSPEFYNRVSGIVESFTTLKAELEQEKRAYQRIWNKREKQLERAAANTAGMYGDLQGLIGSSLKEIALLGLPAAQDPAEADPGPAALARADGAG